MHACIVLGVHLSLLWTERTQFAFHWYWTNIGPYMCVAVTKVAVSKLVGDRARQSWVKELLPQLLWVLRKPLMQSTRSVIEIARTSLLAFFPIYFFSYCCPSSLLTSLLLAQRECKRTLLLCQASNNLNTLFPAFTMRPNCTECLSYSALRKRNQKSASASATSFHSDLHI